jgi:uncharacterized membrane protein
MTLSPLLMFHVSAATTALFSGSLSMFSPKGGRLHRLAGNIFFVSMLAMSASAAYMAGVKLQRINAIVGVLTFYMVATAWMTVVRKDGETGRFEYAALLVALADGAAAMSFGFQTQHGVIVLNDGPAAGCFVFGGLALFAAALDVRVLLRGGVSGAQRIARHLWRMSYALLITAVSAFVGKQQVFHAISLLFGQQQMFPQAVRQSPLVYLPIAAIALSMIYWLIRIHFGRAFRKAGKPVRPVAHLAGQAMLPGR